MMSRIRYRTRSVAKEEASMSRLPIDVLVNILSRLAVKNIIQCRCVCKTWRQLLLDPYFAKHHLAVAPINLLLWPPPRYEHFFLFDPCNNAMVKFRNNNFNFPWSKVQVVDACNGLLCLLHMISDGVLYIYNPIFGEYIKLPGTNQGMTGFCCEDLWHIKQYFFGYSSLSNKYKVLQIVPRKDNRVPNGYVYTVGTDTWRSIGDISYPYLRESFGIPLDGSFHWITYKCDNISRFDVANEQVRNIPLPSDYSINKDLVLGGLGVLGNCLSIFYHNKYGCQIEIWSMKIYGIADSWSKDFVLEDSCFTSYKPITMQEDGSIFMVQSDQKIVLYNPKTKEFQKIDMNGISFSYFDVNPLLPSLVSLKDIVEE